MPAHPSIEAIAAIASGHRLGSQCRHCGLRRGYKSQRGLCCPCFDDRAIRGSYPKLSNACGKKDGVPALPPIELLPDRGPDLPRLPAAANYHGRCADARCEHGLADGCCAPCERDLRARLGIVEQNGASDG